MSLLKNALRSVLPGRPVPQDDLPPQGAPQAADPDAASVPPATEGTPPAWRLLGTQTGVQDHGYEEITRPAVRRLFGHEPRRVLDVGCAAGTVGMGLKKSIPGVWVWGCEPSERAAQVAATRLDHVTTVPREQWNAADLALLETVDTVLLLDVLEHMYNPWGELEFLAQRLQRGAQVIVSLPNLGHISVLGALSHGQFPYGPEGILDITHVRFFTLGSMLEMFEQTGFQVEAAEILSRSQGMAIAAFPARVVTGRMELEVESEGEWERLNAIQFGFRLRRKGD